MITRRDRVSGRSLRHILVRVLALGALGIFPLFLGTASASAAGQHTVFVFSSPRIAGAPTGSVAMTGVGSYDAPTGPLQANGVFRCTDAVAQGPLAGCLSGQGVRWSSTTLNPTQRFVCGTDAAKTVTTDNQTVAFNADFFR